MPRLETTGDVRVLDLGTRENRIDPDWIATLAAALDEVEAAPPPRALVTTASGKFFGLGLDLEWMAANPDGVPELVASMHEAFARMLELPVPTVAALRCHAFAGSGLFALAHDYRVMCDDRCYFGLPEIDVGIAISPGLIDLVKARVPPQTAHAALTGGRRYKGPAALEAGIVDALASVGDVLPKAVSIAQELAGKDSDTYGTMKARLYRDVVESLRDREANFADVQRFRTAFEAMGVAHSEA